MEDYTSYHQVFGVHRLCIQVLLSFIQKLIPQSASHIH